MNSLTLDTVYVKPSPQSFAYFIDGDIGDPSEYRELSQILISMQEGDTLELTINCFGGYLHTTTMLSNLIRNCKGVVHGILNGVAMSGGSILFLSCHSVDVMPHSRLMAHVSIGSEFGKLSDTSRSLKSSESHLASFYKDIYFGFYSESEIDEILDGKDSYLEYDEICKRLDQRQKLLQETQLSSQQQLQEMFDELDSMSKLPDWTLDKVTKKDLLAYLNGDIDFEIDEENKRIKLIKDRGE